MKFSQLSSTSFFFALYASLVLVALGSVGLRTYQGPARPHYLPYLDLMPTIHLVHRSGEDLGEVTSQFRGGPERLGQHSVSIPGLFLREAWRHRALNVGLHTASKSTPAVDDSGVYVGSDANYFYKFNLDGSLAWRFLVRNSLNGVHSTALLDEKLVYFGAYDGWVYALDKKTGHPVWQVKVGDAIGSSLAYADGFLYVGVETLGPTNGYLVKIRRSDGRVLWRSPHINEHPHSSPAIDVTRKLAYMGNNRGFVYGFDIETGKVRWATLVGGPIKGALTIINGRVIGNTWQQTAFALNADSGALIWRTQISDWGQTSPTIVPISADRSVAILTAKGHIYGIDLNSGAMLWAKSVGYGRMGLTSGLATRNARGNRWVVWIACGEMKLCVLDPKNGEALQTIDVGGFVSGAPVIWRDSLYLALDRPSGDLVRYVIQ